jgi:hypothetical protein
MSGIGWVPWSVATSLMRTPLVPSADADAAVSRTSAAASGVEQ